MHVPPTRWLRRWSQPQRLFLIIIMHELGAFDEKAAAGVFLTETKSAIHTLLEIMNERQADRQIKRVLFCVYV